MLKKVAIFFLIFVSLSGSLYFLSYLKRQQSESEIIRKLSAMRLALTLYCVNSKKKALSPADLIKAGYLEEVPVLKLSWRFPSQEVELVDSFSIKNTGHWAYVKNPQSPDFGLLFIDSSAKDTKNRDWSLL